MNHQIGKYIIITGVFIILIGTIVYFFGNVFRWMGRMPGDIRIENQNTRFYFPITTMVIISIILTFVVNIIKRFL